MARIGLAILLALLLPSTAFAQDAFCAALTRIAGAASQEFRPIRGSRDTGATHYEIYNTTVLLPEMNDCDVEAETANEHAVYDCEATLNGSAETLTRTLGDRAAQCFGATAEYTEPAVGSQSEFVQAGAKIGAYMLGSDMVLFTVQQQN